LKKTDKQPQIILIEDTREQLGYSSLFTRECRRAALTYGDYSVAGLESLIAVERKSLPDLLGSLTSGRDRFETELKRARSLHKMFVILECRPADILVESFGKLSKAHPRSIWGTVMAWSCRYHPFVFAGNRETAAKITEGLLVAYASEFFKQAESIRKATEGKKCKKDE
jgi:DNA excision repair protein ERCC-4